MTWRWALVCLIAAVAIALFVALLWALMAAIAMAGRGVLAPGGMNI